MVAIFISRPSFKLRGWCRYKAEKPAVGKLLPATVRVDAIFSGEISGCGCSLKRISLWSDFLVNREFNREKLKFWSVQDSFQRFHSGLFH
jgi:hypothetical protein